MKISVIGATGTIGRAVVERCQGRMSKASRVNEMEK